MIQINDNNISPITTNNRANIGGKGAGYCGDVKRIKFDLKKLNKFVRSQNLRIINLIKDSYEIV